MTITLLLVAAAWMLILWLATGLCAAARLGDRTQAQDAFVSSSPAESDAPLAGSGLAA